MTTTQQGPPTTPQDRVPPAGPPDTAPTYDPRHRGLRVAGAAVVALAVVGSTVGSVPEMVRDAEVQEFALPDGTHELRISTDAGDVDVRSATADAAPGITAHKHWSFREPQARVDSSGGVTTVTMDCPGILAGAMTFGQCYADWTVSVPEDVKVVVRTHVGDVDLTDLTGELVVTSSVGDVAVNGSPSRLDVSTSVGDVTAVLRDPADLVDVSTSVGDVVLTLPGDTSYDVRASSLEPADVQVDTSQESDHEVRVESSVGAVRISSG